jgi:hypothetical protein
MKRQTKVEDEAHAEHHYQDNYYATIQTENNNSDLNQNNTIYGNGK